MRRVSPRGYNIRNSARLNRYSPEARFTRIEHFRGSVCMRNFRLFPPLASDRYPGYTVAVCGCHAIRTHNNAIPGSFVNTVICRYQKASSAVSVFYFLVQARHARYALPDIGKQSSTAFQQACSSSQHDFSSVISLSGAIGWLNYPFPAR